MIILLHCSVLLPSPNRQQHSFGGYNVPNARYTKKTAQNPPRTQKEAYGKMSFCRMHWNKPGPLRPHSHQTQRNSLNSGVTIVSMAAGVKQNQAPGIHAASTNIFKRMGHSTEWYHNRMSPMQQVQF